MSAKLNDPPQDRAALEVLVRSLILEREQQPLDAVPFELQFQIGVRKATGTPMLLGHDVG
jgi:hypothetical protein